jgi:hypothetical protein
MFLSAAAWIASCTNSMETVPFKPADFIRTPLKDC